MMAHLSLVLTFYISASDFIYKCKPSYMLNQAPAYGRSNTMDI